jgi:ABC-type phosphate transport system auxiliary subunit
MTKKSIGFIVALCVSMSGWASELIVPKELQGKIKADYTEELEKVDKRIKIFNEDLHELQKEQKSIVLEEMQKSMKYVKYAKVKVKT